MTYPACWLYAWIGAYFAVLRFASDYAPFRYGAFVMCGLAAALGVAWYANETVKEMVRRAGGVK